jgi:hypothetical protein
MKQGSKKVSRHRNLQETIRQLRVSEQRYQRVSELISDYAYAVRIKRDGTPVPVAA